MIAAFIKRLARLALGSPVTGSAIALPFIYNLLRRHAPCLTLIHKLQTIEEGDESADSEDLGKRVPHDPFDMDQPDPSKARALHSSLWELQVLRQHYAPDISKMANIFEDPITRQKPELSLAEALEITYRSLFEKNSNKKVKGGVPLTFQAPESVFRTSDESE
eukprot:CAMPEP_0184306826 /NCGR_PEP_ID=MMETSP1049-20130417/15724_1 /TAXON_ID=77928 /ORGANISM="Proteomonas sulcata, Strain CCMP704" /LENGTH=162 /DNA_ID=CAMNT_0026619173 /DNA_START=48 /DNA_END=533 /DNA_ORIENTATION=+